MKTQTLTKIEEENRRLDNIGTDAAAMIHGSRLGAAATIGLSETIEESTEKLITSNKQLAESTDKHAAAMVKLTWALVGVGVLQVAVLAAQIIISRTK